VKRVLLIIILANIMAVYVDSCLLFTLLQNLTELFSTKFLRISTFSFSCSYVRHIIYEHVLHIAYLHNTWLPAKLLYIKL